MQSNLNINNGSIKGYVLTNSLEKYNNKGNKMLNSNLYNSIKQIRD